MKTVAAWTVLILFPLIFLSVFVLAKGLLFTVIVWGIVVLMIGGAYTFVEALEYVLNKLDDKKFK